MVLIFIFYKNFCIFLGKFDNWEMGYLFKYYVLKIFVDNNKIFWYMVYICKWFIFSVSMYYLRVRFSFYFSVLLWFGYLFGCVGVSVFVDCCSYFIVEKVCE